MPSETYQKQQVAVNGTPTTVLTAAASTQVIVKSMFVTNVSGAQTVFQMWQGGSANTNQICAPTTLQSGEYGAWDGTLTLAAGDTLVAQCSQTAGATVTIESVVIQ